MQKCETFYDENVSFRFTFLAFELTNLFSLLNQTIHPFLPNFGPEDSFPGWLRGCALS